MLDRFFGNPGAKIDKSIKSNFSELNHEQTVLNDELLGLGIAEQSGKEAVLHLEFLKSIGQKQAEFILRAIKEKLWSDPETIKEKLKFFKNNYSLPLNDQEAELFLANNEETKNIDYAKAKELNLELNLVRGSEAAGRLVREVIDKKIDFKSKKGRTEFVKRWQEQCPNLPMPEVSEYGFGYFRALSEGKIITNFNPPPEGQGNQLATPKFHEDEFLFVDNWKEYNAGPVQEHFDKIIARLLNNVNDQDFGNVVNVSRQTIDGALWIGDPANRQQTERHQKILQELGCDPKQFELRLIREDEYLRLAPSKGYGQKNISTYLDNYYDSDNARLNLLVKKTYNKDSITVDRSTWVTSEEHYTEAVRLVISPRENKEQRKG